MGCIAETDVLNGISHDGGLILTVNFVNIFNKVTNASLIERDVGKARLFGQNVIEHGTANGCIDDTNVRLIHAVIVFVKPGAGAKFDFGVNANLVKLISQQNLIDITKNTPITLLRGVIVHGQIVHTQDHVLSRTDNRFATGWF